MKNNLSNANTTGYLKFNKIIYYIIGIIEILLAFRFVFKTMGVNPESNLVANCYSVSQLLLSPFNGLFRMAVTNVVETSSIFEPTLILAMFAYALLAYLIVRFNKVINNHKEPELL